MIVMYNHYVFSSFINDKKIHTFIVDFNRNDTIDIYNKDDEMINFNTIADILIRIPVKDNKSFYDILYDYIARENNINSIVDKYYKTIKIDNTLSINDGNVIIVLDGNELYFGHSIFVIFSALHYIKEYNIKDYVKFQEEYWKVK